MCLCCGNKFVNSKKMQNLKNKVFCKMICGSECSCGFLYHDGLNVITKSFAKNQDCCENGFYISDIKNFWEIIDEGDCLMIVELPFTDPDFKCLKNGNSWLSNKFF